jgi:hypothetical protein
MIYPRDCGHHVHGILWQSFSPRLWRPELSLTLSHFWGALATVFSVTSSSLGWIFLCLSPSAASHSNGAGHISIMMLENADGYILVLSSQGVRELTV